MIKKDCVYDSALVNKWVRKIVLRHEFRLIIPKATPAATAPIAIGRFF